MEKACKKCGTTRTREWWKCCPEHTSEDDPDVVCTECALYLHPEWSGLDLQNNPLPLTREQAAIVGAFTGYLLCSVQELKAYAESVLERPVFIHEIGLETFEKELKEAAREDFIRLGCKD